MMSVDKKVMDKIVSNEEKVEQNIIKIDG
jgi:hypothetical protein